MTFRVGGVRIAGDLDCWDVEGQGETIAEALLALAAECRKDAVNQRRLAGLLEAEADRCERMARAATAPEEETP